MRVTVVKKAENLDAAREELACWQLVEYLKANEMPAELVL